MSTTTFPYDPPADRFGEPLEMETAPDSGAWFARAGYLLAALLLTGTVVGSVNPAFGFFGEMSGFDAHRWPWEALVAPDGRIAWTPEVGWILTLSACALLTLVAVFLPSLGRATLGLVVAALVGVALLPADRPTLPWCGMSAAVALLLAAAVTANASPGSSGARGLTLTALIVLAGLLLIPLPPEGPDIPGNPPEGYRAWGIGTVEAVIDIIKTGEGPTGESPWRQLAGIVPQIAWVLGLLVGLLMLLGLGRPWAPWVLTLLLLAIVLGPPAFTALRRVELAREQWAASTPFTSQDVFQQAVWGASESIAMLERLLMLPLALGLIDLMRPRRPTY